ncbi:MAG: hypothetical protein ITG01_14405 [Comamonas sp.]|nr:hypothetical protein [Comamonas sp.]
MSIEKIFSVFIAGSLCCIWARGLFGSYFCFGCKQLFFLDFAGFFLSEAAYRAAATSFLVAQERKQRTRLRRYPAKLAVRQRRFAQTAAGKMIFYLVRARRFRAHGGGVESRG